MDWFLNDNGLSLERVKVVTNDAGKELCLTS